MKYIGENRLAVLFMSDLNGSEEACVLNDWQLLRSYAAVPHTILRNAIGTFHIGKSTSSSAGVTLHGNFLARIATQSAHLPRVITANYPVRRSTLGSFLKLSSACLNNVTRQVDLQKVEVRCQSRVSRSRSRAISSSTSRRSTVGTFHKWRSSIYS